MITILDLQVCESLHAGRVQCYFHNCYVVRLKQALCGVGNESMVRNVYIIVPVLCNTQN